MEALQLECNVLFLGFGPVTHSFAKRLIGNGYKVVAVTDHFMSSKTKSEFSSDSLTIMNWQSAILQEIRSESTYIGWRQLPQIHLLGNELINWVKSPKIETRKIHHLSSASVYAGDKELFIESDHDFRIKKIDMNSKQKLEHLVSEVAEEKETRFVNFRISNVYGSNLNKGFINEAINSIKQKQAIKIFRRLDLVRDYLSIDDLIEALIELRLNDFSDDRLNLSSGQGLAISDIVTELKKLISDDLMISDVEPPEGILSRSVLSCERLEEIIPWKPICVQDSLKIMAQDLI